MMALARYITICHRILIIACCFLALGQAQAASNHKSPEDAVALVKKALAFLHTHGAEKTFKEISTPGGTFSDGQLYAFVLTTDGICVAHGAYPNLIGKNLNNLRDPDGVAPIAEFIKVANKKEGKGWVEYRWPDPVSHRIEHKRSYVERDGKWIVGVGISYDPKK